MAKIFTKKVVLIALAVVIALGGIIWAIVANMPAKFNSGIDSLPQAVSVSGNGSASVMVDEYLYFVGGSVVTSSIKYGENEYFPKGKIPDTGIYRVKIGDENKPLLDYVYDNSYVDEESGKTEEYQPGDKEYNTVVTGINDWSNIGKKGNGINAVVPKIAGHDNTAMWVYGKYLIYTSPHNRRDKVGNLKSSYIDFFRVDLDGRNHELIYTSDSADLTTSNFTVWADSRDNINLLVHETGSEARNTTPRIEKINVQTGKKVTLAENVSNVVMPSVTQYRNDVESESLGKVFSGVMGNVYYTKARESSSLKGNLLYCCSINSGEVKQLAQDGTSERGTTFTPIAVVPYGVGSAQFVFAVKDAEYDSSNNPSVVYINNELCVITNENLASYAYQKPNHNSWTVADKTVKIYANGFCTLDNNLFHYTIDNASSNSPRLQRDTDGNGEAKKLLVNTVDAVLAVLNDTIYVQSGSSVYAVNKDGSQKEIAVNIVSESTEDSDTVSTLPTAVVYQIGNEPFVFVQDTNNIRLCSVNQTYKLRLFN